MSYLGLKEYEPIKWSEVADKISGELAKGVAKVEKSKRDAEDLAADSIINNSKFDQTKIESINQVVFSLTQNSKNKTKRMYDMMVDGEITMSDWKRFQQNQNVSIASYKKMLTNVAKDAEKLIEREDIASESELLTRNKLVSTLTDPTAVPVTDDLGNIFLMNSETYEQVQANLDFYEKDKFDPITSIDAATKGIAKFADFQNGKYVITEQGIGKINKIRETTVNLAMEDELNMVDVLTRYPELAKDGVEYSSTTDKSEAKKDPTKVLMIWDGQKYVPDTKAPNWEKQREEVKRRMNDLFDSRIPYEVQKPTFKTPSSRGGGGSKKNSSINRMPFVRRVSSDIKTGTMGEYSKFVPFLRILPNQEQRLVSFQSDPQNVPNKYIYEIEDGRGGTYIESITLSDSQLAQFVNDAINRYTDANGNKIYVDVSFADAVKADEKNVGRNDNFGTTPSVNLNASQR